MKPGKFIKRMVFALLTVLMAVTVIPYHSSVKADSSDEYPDEVYFPIQVLDFREDDLLFEWQGTDGSDIDLSLTFDYHGEGVGKGLVEDTLGPDGLPVYKRETVETVASAVQKRMHWGWGSSLVGTNSSHYLSMKKYIGASESILNEDTNARVSESRMWVPNTGTDSLRLIIVGNESREYTLSQSAPYTHTHSHTYDNVYAEVWDDNISLDTPIYILTKDAIIFFYNISVSRTFTLSANTTYQLSGWGQQQSGKTVVTITDQGGNRTRAMDPSSVEEVKTGADGKITVEIAVGPVSTAPGAELPDAMASGNNYQTYCVWKLNLKPKSWDDPAYAGSNPYGGSSAVIYPLGNYDESKAKFDGDPDLGWTDIRTCMDYAYFVTSHFFKYHPSLNENFDKYQNLVFHKVDEDGKISYEFAAADPLLDNVPSPALKLIYNNTKGTIRNAYGTDTGSSVDGDVVKSGGAFFLVDELSPFKKFPTVDKDRYAPIDGGYHNFHYTVKSSSKFVYKAGAQQYFYFAGDDDVYVFVNGHLYIDLGGAHSPLSDQINLDDIAAAHPEWGIVSGQVVSLDLFYMERHTDQANFYAKMNFKLATDEVSFKMPYEVIPYGYLVDLDYSLTTLRELVTNKNITFTDNFGNVIGAEGFELVDGVSLKYKDENDRGTGVLTVTVTNADGSKDEVRSKVFEFAGLYSYNAESGKWETREFTSDEINAVKSYFENLEVTQGEVITINGPQYDTSYKAYNEYDDIGGETVAEKGLGFVTQVSYDAWQEGAQVATKSTAKKTTPVKVLIGSFKVYTAQEDNEKKKLADYGEFTIDRDLYGESEYARKDPMPYTNNPDNITITEYVFSQVPRGKFTIKLDDSVLTSYIVTVNGEEVTELTIDFEPEYDPEQNTWIYPDLNFELKAKRNAPDLRGLT